LEAIVGLKLGELVAYIKADKRHLDKGLVEAQVEMAEAGKKGAEGFTKAADGKLQADRGRFTRHGRELGAVLGDGIGEKAGRGLVGGVSDALASLPLTARGALITGAVGIGAAMAPFVGAAISGAVLGGVGTGGIIGGIALAAQDSRVKAEAKSLGNTIMSDLTSGAGVFVGPVLDVLDRLKPAAASVTASIGRDFRILAPLVPPVARGIGGLATNAMPGLEHATEAARVPVRALSNELPDLGDAASDALDSIASESDNAAQGIIGFSDAIEGTIRGAGEWLAFLAWTYGGIVKIGDALHDFANEGSPFGEILRMAGGPQGNAFLDWFDNQTNALHDAQDASGDYKGSLEEVIAQTQDAAAANKALTDSFDKLFGIQMSTDEAAIRYQESIDKTVETLKENKRTLDINTEAGRENKEAILDQIQAIDKVRDANIANGDSIDVANGKYDAQLEQLRKTLLKLGLNKTEVNKLIDAYKDVPRNVSTEVAAPGLAKVLAQLREVDRLFHDSAGYHGYRAGERDTSRRWGGITEHAATGLLRDAGIYSAQSPARYAFAEPATGGEAFVPRRGDYGRSMGILSQAAGWYGATVIPGGAAGSGYAGPDTIVVVADLGEGIREVVRINLREHNRQTVRRNGVRR
jgi:hypothetical protein